MAVSCTECGLRFKAGDTFCPADGSKLEDTDDTLLGETVGKYRIVRLLGEGGMGRVYLGLHPGIGSRVAIKLLSSQASSDDDLVQRFFAEAKVVNKIRHEGIVNVIDLDHLPDGRPFITMEYLDGVPLSTVLAQGPMGLGTAARIGIEILEALQAAHNSGVVHRDLKPDNIFISPKGRVKLLDFGIAKLMPEFETTASGPSTRTGSLLGTPGYMAPEQVTGSPVSGATDLYAVGAILYEALTGTMAFSANTLFELLRRIVSEPPMPPVERRAELAGPFEALILRALAKQPEERFASAQVMAQALGVASAALAPEVWAAPEPILVPQGNRSRKTPKQLALESEATLLPGTVTAAEAGHSEPVAGSDGSRRPISGVESAVTMQALPEGSLPIPSGTLPAPASGDTNNSEPSGPLTRSRAHKRWLGLGALAAVSVAGIAMVLPTDAPSTALAPANAPEKAAEAPMGELARASITDAGVVPSKPVPSKPVPSKPVPSKLVPSKLVPSKLVPSKLVPSKLVPSKLPVAARPPVSPTSPVARAPDAGTSAAKSPLPAKGQIRTPADFNPRAFDAVAYVPKARKLAKKLYADAVLIEFDVDGVGANGLTNLGLSNFEASYQFLSPSHSARTLPIGAEDERPCWVYVDVEKTGVTTRIVSRDECKGKARPNPKCSLGEVWKRSDVLGAPPGKKGAVARITYLWDGWFFDIDPLNVTGSIADDC